jgi:transcriptional regulator with XRE-family HTH domain
MKERQKRLKEVYEYVRRFFGIHTQEDFAKSLHKSRNAVTLALNGNEKYLTDNLFTNICEAFQGVFDLNYLLTGDGTLLAPTSENETQKDSAAESSPTPFIPSWADAFFDIMTQQIKQNEALNRELRQSIEKMNLLIDKLSKLKLQ